MGRVLAIAAAGLMVLTACGGDDEAGGDGGGAGDAGTGDARTQDYVDAVAAVIAEDETAPATPEMADCMAEAIVEVVGVETLVEAEISAEEFGDAENLSSLDVDVPDDTVHRLGAALADCDIADEFEGLFLDIFSTGFSDDTDFELPPDTADCLLDNLDDQAVTDAIAGAYVDEAGAHIQQLLLEALAACPSMMTALLVATMPPGGLPSTEDCIKDFVEADTDRVAEAFVSASPEAIQELGTALAAACPGFAATEPVIAAAHRSGSSPAARWAAADRVRRGPPSPPRR